MLVLFYDLCIHVGVVFALIVFLLVSFLSLCIRVCVSLGSVYSLSMSIQDMCTRVDKTKNDGRVGRGFSIQKSL